VSANPTYDYRGQVALVTGAAKEIGLATAQAGAAVVLADTDDPAARAAADELTAAGHQALAAPCDVSDEDQVAALIERIVTAFGRLDMAFNNAGIMIPPSDAADEPAGNFDRVKAVNLRGVWTCMKHELRQMRAQGSGAIVTAHPSAVSSGSPEAPPTTPPSTASSALPRAPPWSTRRAAFASTPSAPAPSRRRWSTP
jgi:NAD(P)-dependent dehydrogenase (short-subunit alcohol dehydrogenase family)